MVANKMPDRKDNNYVTQVLAVQPQKADLTKPKDDAGTKTALIDQKSYCNELISAWSDCPAVVSDCKTPMDNATQAIADGKWTDADDALWQVRRRLVLASNSCSAQSRSQVIWLAIWTGCMFALCAFLILWLKLLPGWTPKVAADVENVAVLLSSFLFGFLGGVFDAATALSKNYTTQSYDTRYWLWYIFGPFLGGILGVVVFAVFLAGLLTVSGTGIAGSAQAATTTTTTTVVTTTAAVTTATATTPAVIAAAATTAASATRDALILVLAFIAGFKQITVIKYLERLATTIFGGNGDSSAKS